MDTITIESPWVIATVSCVVAICGGALVLLAAYAVWRHNRVVVVF
jgi:hypothetical protein